MITRVRTSQPRRILLVLLGGLMATQVVMADPPGRVARLSHSQGEVSHSPYGSDDWIGVNRNRALSRGDRLWADRRALAELQVGHAVLRMAAETSLEILDLDDQIAQFEVTQGSVNLRVNRLYNGQIYEIATPTLAFTIDQPGRYRIDVDPRSNETTIIVWEGGGDAWGDNSRFAVREGDAVRFDSADLRRYDLFDLPRTDAFDRYCLDRDRRLDRSPSLRYVDADLIGYADLDEYGSWRDVGSYGGVWFPRRVAADWAPYRDGHWVWQDPWGWTWVDDAPWGFAPSHYGRWVQVSNRWGWVPGPRASRAVYAPALVAFIGGNNWSASLSRGNDAPVGWFPLGPREVFLPGYRASRGYLDRVNMSNTIVTRTSITSVYNNYSGGRGSIAQSRYANRDVGGSVTVVPGSVFRNGRAVRGATLRMDSNALAAGEITRRIDIAPGARSVRGNAVDARAQPADAVFDRRVLARHAAPARADSLIEPGSRDRSQADPARRGTASAPQGEQSAQDNVRQILQRSMIDARAAGAETDTRARGERNPDAAAAARDGGERTSRTATDAPREPAASQRPDRQQRAPAAGALDPPQDEQPASRSGRPDRNLPPQSAPEPVDEVRVQERARQDQQRMIERQQDEQRAQAEQQRTNERAQQDQQRIEQERQRGERDQQRAQQDQQQMQERQLRGEENQLREQERNARRQQQRIEPQPAAEEQPAARTAREAPAQDTPPPDAAAVEQPGQPLRANPRRNQAPANPDGEKSEQDKLEQEKAEKDQSDKDKADNDDVGRQRND